MSSFFFFEFPFLFSKFASNFNLFTLWLWSFSLNFPRGINASHVFSIFFFFSFPFFLAGCELGFSDEAKDKSLPFFPFGSSLEKSINVPADQNCSFYFGNQLHVNYLRCDGTWKSQSLSSVIEVTRGWSISQLSIKVSVM